jgi:hypothetical protein
LQGVLGERAARLEVDGDDLVVDPFHVRVRSA